MMPLIVRRLERFGDLSGDRQRLANRNRAAGDDVREVLTLDELHGQRWHAARTLQAVDRRDVRVAQPGEQLRLALEAGQPPGIARNLGRQVP